jgi:hypothetical protein
MMTVYIVCEHKPDTIYTYKNVLSIDKYHSHVRLFCLNEQGILTEFAFRNVIRLESN